MSEVRSIHDVASQSLVGVDSPRSKNGGAKVATLEKSITALEASLKEALEKIQSLALEKERMREDTEQLRIECERLKEIIKAREEELAKVHAEKLNALREKYKAKNRELKKEFEKKEKVKREKSKLRREKLTASNEKAVAADERSADIPQIVVGKPAGTPKKVREQIELAKEVRSVREIFGEPTALTLLEEPQSTVEAESTVPSRRRGSRDQALLHLRTDWLSRASSDEVPLGLPADASPKQERRVSQKSQASPKLNVTEQLLAPKPSKLIMSPSITALNLKGLDDPNANAPLTARDGSQTARARGLNRFVSFNSPRGNVVDSTTKPEKQPRRMDLVAILHSGGPYAATIDRLVRGLGVNTKVFPLSINADVLVRKKVKAIIVSGGPACANDPDLEYDKRIFQLGIPLLGICLGMQIMAVQSPGGKVEAMGLGDRKVGQFLIDIDTSSRIFAGLEAKELVTLTHDDTVVIPGGKNKIIARNSNYGPTLIAAMSDEDKNLYALQFHPEASLTVNGKRIFKNFLFRISGVHAPFTDEAKIYQSALQQVQTTVGEKKRAVMIVPGTMEDACFICAVLMHRAIGMRFAVIAIRTGCERLTDSEKHRSLSEMGIAVNVIDVSAAILKEFQHAESSSEKQQIVDAVVSKTIGEYEVEMERELKNSFLVQSTLRSETFSHSDTVYLNTIRLVANNTSCSHVYREKGRLLEPFRHLYWEQVFQIGRQMGLQACPNYPLPPAGLACRVISNNEPVLDTDVFMQEALDNSFVFLSELLSDDIALEPDTERLIQKALQPEEMLIFREVRRRKAIAAGLFPFLSPGEGDGPVGKFVCYLHSPLSPNWPHLFVIAKVIGRVLSSACCRVVYLFGELNANTVPTFSKTVCSSDTIKLLQTSDDIVFRHLVASGEVNNISNIPVFLLPLGQNGNGKVSIVVRPVIVNDFIHGRSAMPGKDLKERTVTSLWKNLKQALEMFETVQYIFYDLSASPISTFLTSIEWETRLFYSFRVRSNGKLESFIAH